MLAREAGHVSIIYYPRAPGTSTAHPPAPDDGDDWPAVVRAGACSDPRFGPLARMPGVDDRTQIARQESAIPAVFALFGRIY